LSILRFFVWRCQMLIGFHSWVVSFSRAYIYSICVVLEGRWLASQLGEIIYIVNFIVMDTWNLKLNFIAVVALFKLILYKLLIDWILDLKVIKVHVILSIWLYLIVHELVQVFFILVVIDSVILGDSYGLVIHISCHRSQLLLNI
jgi:hypothetical protein